MKEYNLQNYTPSFQIYVIYQGAFQQEIKED